MHQHLVGTSLQRGILDPVKAKDKNVRLMLDVSKEKMTFQRFMGSHFEKNHENLQFERILINNFLKNLIKLLTH